MLGDEEMGTGTVEIKRTGDSFRDHVSELRLQERKKYVRLLLPLFF